MSSDDAIRLGLFALVFLVIAGWEILAPRRSLNFSRNIRWSSNIGMSLLNQLVLRLCFPVLLVGLNEFRREDKLLLPALLLQPFSKR